jgi:hypothetical protein
LRELNQEKLRSNQVNQGTESGKPEIESGLPEIESGKSRSVGGLQVTEVLDFGELTETYAGLKR